MVNDKPIEVQRNSTEHSNVGIHQFVQDLNRPDRSSPSDRRTEDRAPSGSRETNTSTLSKDTVNDTSLKGGFLDLSINDPLAPHSELERGLGRPSAREPERGLGRSSEPAGERGLAPVKPKAENSPVPEENPGIKLTPKLDAPSTGDKPTAPTNSDTAISRSKLSPEFLSVIDQLGVENKENFLAKNETTMSSWSSAKNSDERSKIFSNAVDEFVKENPHAAPSAFASVLNGALRNNSDLKNLNVVLHDDHVYLLDRTNGTKENPAKVVGEKFIGVGDPVRNKELQLGISAANEMIKPIADANINATDLQRTLNQTLKRASREALDRAPGQDRIDTLDQLRRDVVSELSRLGASVPRPFDAIRMDSQSEPGNLFLQMRTFVEGNELKFE